MKTYYAATYRYENKTIVLNSPGILELFSTPNAAITWGAIQRDDAIEAFAVDADELASYLRKLPAGTPVNLDSGSPDARCGTAAELAHGLEVRLRTEAERN